MDYADAITVRGVPIVAYWVFSSPRLCYHWDAFCLYPDDP